MGQAIPTQHPAVVLRSHYTHLRILLAIAMIAVIGLSVAVVVLAAAPARARPQPRVAANRPPGCTSRRRRRANATTADRKRARAASSPRRPARGAFHGHDPLAPRAPSLRALAAAQRRTSLKNVESPPPER